MIQSLDHLDQEEGDDEVTAEADRSSAEEPVSSSLALLAPLSSISEVTLYMGSRLTLDSTDDWTKHFLLSQGPELELSTWKRKKNSSCVTRRNLKLRRS